MTAMVRLIPWYVDYTEAIPTIRLSFIDTGILTSSNDEPASAAYRPRIVNPEAFSCEQAGSFWPIRGELGGGPSQYEPLQIDDYDGAYSALARLDLRGAKIVIAIVPSKMLADNWTMFNARPLHTAILDTAERDPVSRIVTVHLRGTISQFDRVLGVRRFPPFLPSGIAGRPLSWLIGAVRNITPPVIDDEELILQLSDRPVTNVVAVRDEGARLDRSATPPQFTPARDSTCLELESPPSGKITIDCSSEGGQAPSPTVPDVLGGKGRLTDWPTAGNPPTGWTVVNAAYGSFARLDHTQSPQDYVASMMTNRRYSPTSGSYGYPWRYPANLQPGKTYRISIKLYRTIADVSAKVGLMVRTDLLTGSAGSVTGDQPLQQPQFTTLAYTSVYKCPPGAARPIYVIAVGDPTYASAAVICWYDLVVEEMGEYVETPMQGATLATAFRELLVVRDGQPSSCYVESDLTAIYSSTGFEIGRYYTEPPHIPTALQEFCDTYCATIFEDSEGRIRVARLVEPAYGLPLFDVAKGINLESPVVLSDCEAQYLTDRIGVARNWSPPGDADFVSDTDEVPLSVRERYKRQSQYELRSTIAPAGHYGAAESAPVFHSLLDKPEHGQVAIDSVMRLFAPKIIYGRPPMSGKRQWADLIVTFDDITQVGATVKCELQDVMIGRVLWITDPDNGLQSVPALIVKSKPFGFAGRLQLRALI